MMAHRIEAELLVNCSFTLVEVSNFETYALEFDSLCHGTCMKVVFSKFYVRTWF